MNYTTKELNEMETIRKNSVYGELKIDTDKKRVYIDENNNITTETYVNGADSNFWDVETISGDTQ